MTADLVEWLRAQLDDDESRSDLVGQIMLLRWATKPYADRLMREVEAKRLLLDLHRPVADSSWPEPGHCLECCSLESQDYRTYPCPTVRLLALPYSDRPGYREEWRP